MHILTILDKFQGEVVTSEFIAGSININAALVRKEVSNLRKQGLVASKEGKNGGFQLGKPARQIYLSDVYAAVRQSHLLGQIKNNPNPNCPVGKQIDKHLNNLYDDVELALVAKLKKTTLAEFSKKFK